MIIANEARCAEFLAVYHLVSNARSCGFFGSYLHMKMIVRTKSISSLFARYRVKREKIKFVSTSGHVIYSVYCINISVFDNFSKISEDFLFQRPDKRFRTFFITFRRLPKIAEDFRGRTDLSIIQQQIGVLPTRLCS